MRQYVEGSRSGAAGYKQDGGSRNELAGFGSRCETAGLKKCVKQQTAAVEQQGKGNIEAVEVSRSKTARRQ